VTAASFDEATSRWTIETDRGRFGFREVLHHGDQLSICAENSGYQGPRRIPRQAVSHRSNGARYRHRAQTSTFGLAAEQNVKSAFEVSPEEREAEYEQRWRIGDLAMYGAYSDLFTNKDANDTAEFVRSKIRGMVNDPTIAEKLSPSSYPLGTKRISVGTGY
jgi:cation diffusion facilitator CzcD-associated flavoprotein CzcO